VLALADASVRAHYVPPAQAVGLTRARRRRGAMPRARRDPDAAREVAERYTAELARELGL
jgi:hypothetical protein